MNCIRCDAVIDAPPLAGGPVWCPACVAKSCCSRSGTCVHRRPANGFARAAIAAAALLVASSCTTASRDRVAASVTTAPSPAPAGVPRPYPIRGSAEGHSATTTTSGRPSSPSRPSRSGSRPSVPRVSPAPARERGAAATIVIEGDEWDALAACESTGDRDGKQPHRINPTAYNPAGPFFGAFQFLLKTFHNLGGQGDPRDHSYAEQKAIAQKIPKSAWPRQFPSCSRALGVR